MIRSLRKSLSETSAPRPEPKFHTLFAPLLELAVVGDAAFEGDRIEAGAARRLARGRERVAALAVFDQFGAALEGAHLADAGDVATIPLDAEFEVLVGIEALRVDAELCHDGLSLGFDLSGHLLDLDDDELGRLERREADQDVHDAAVDVVLGGGFGVALDEVGVARAAAWKAPWRNRSCMKAPMLSRICAHSGESFGSNTTHCVPRNRLSSMYSASRRTGRYFHSDASRIGAGQRACAPQAGGR